MTKTLIILILFIMAAPRLAAQSQENKLLIEEYILQSEKQKKTGLIMIGVGTVAFALGALVIDNSYGLEDPSLGSGLILSLGGGVSALIGIPILISSGSKARKAAKLSLEATKIQNSSIPGQQTKVFPAVGVSIPLNTIKP